MRRLAPFCLLGLVLAAGSTSRAQQPPDESAAGRRVTGPFAALAYRFIGPPGNRASAVAGVPGDFNTYYVGGASGGVWKSVDAGIHWRPVFDDQPAQSIGAIAVAPSDPNIVWVGTGETFIRSNVSLGNGIYRSTDAGKTWAHMGLDLTGRIGRIVVHPKDPDVVLAAALGHAYGQQQERGVYRSADGGKTWTRTLFVDADTGAADVAIDPVNPNNVYAGTWTIDIKTWGRKSGGAGSGVFVSRDGGVTWNRATRGLPAAPLGKIAVSVAPSQPSRVYALIETGQRGTLWRSDDSGDSWRVVNHSRLLNERPHYYTRMLVMPDDHNEVYFPSNGMGVTYDGGETTEQLRGWGGDNHDMWVDPVNADRLMIGNDLGVMISTTHGREWNTVRLPIAQMYHVATDTRIPYNVYGQMQDYYSMRGPSNSLGGSIHPALWTSTAGCETGWNVPDPVNPDIVWGGCYAGSVERFDASTKHSRTVSVWPERTMGAPAGRIKLRMNWTYPIAISPHDHETVYVGSQFVHRTRDGGQTWDDISPDLTLNDPAMMGDSGGLTIDNLSVEYAGAVFAIAESPVEKGVIWAGTNDGLVQVTRDGGATWSNVTANITGMPAKMTVSSVEPSRFDAGTCYIAVDGHQVNIRDPHLYKTTDYGRTWTNIGTGIPKSVLSYTHVVREDPKRRGLLYAGTENALLVSFDHGQTWDSLQTNLPQAPVHWLTIQEHFNDLVVGTYGRGFWILDDITPLQQLTPATRAKAAHLFAPRNAYRFRTIERRDLAPAGASAGRNPPYGASISYWLAKASRDRVELKVLDPAGAVIRTERRAGVEGLNRWWWDLRGEPTREVELRTTPPGNREVWSEKRFAGKDTRSIGYYGIDVPKRGPLVAPGVYTVSLTVGGTTVTEKLTVLKDPNTKGSAADVAASTALAQKIHERTNETVDLINEIEWSRRQLEDAGKMLVGQDAHVETRAAAATLDAKFLLVENELLHPTIAENDLKSFRGPMGLYLKFLWLQAEVHTGGGDVSGNADFAPTRAQLAVYDKLVADLAAQKAALEILYRDDVPAFESLLGSKGLSRVIRVPARTPSVEVPRAHAAAVAAFRAAYEKELLADDGYLTLCGLHYLNDGENSVGSADGSVVRFPADVLPARAGSVFVEKGTYRFALRDGLKARIGSRDVTASPMRISVPEAGQAADRFDIGRTSFWIHMSGARPTVRVRDPQCHVRRAFSGLKWFDVDPAWKATATFTAHPQPVMLDIVNIRGDEAKVPSPGTLHVTVAGHAYDMVPVSDGDDLLVYFSDTTAGVETYKAVRFVKAVAQEDGTYVIDFNTAYNPPCAYSPYTTCPFPPRPNRLPIAIRAGERSYAQ
ncbi:MAG: DUF1684 domain-containing protein [Acidobacteria bacterium]|nr:DUF1684 domain-containing protein [Acidobacteriota bacterium]